MFDSDNKWDQEARRENDNIARTRVRRWSLWGAMIGLLVGLLGLSDGNLNAALFLFFWVVCFTAGFRAVGKAIVRKTLPAELRICTKCGVVATPRLTHPREKGHSSGCLLLFILFYPILYFFYLLKEPQKKLFCPACGSMELLPLDTPMAKKLLEELCGSKQDRPSQRPPQTPPAFREETVEKPPAEVSPAMSSTPPSETKSSAESASQRSACKDCGGTGSVPCPLCGGSGRESDGTVCGYYRCKGTGRVPCPNCAT